MTHIQKHVARMLAGDQTTAIQATNSLLDAMRAFCRDTPALQRLKRHVLVLVFADPLGTAQAICDCITPEAWKAAMQRPDFEANCRIE